MTKEVKYNTDVLYHGNTETTYNLCSGQHRNLTEEEIILLGHKFVKWVKTIKKPFRPGKFFRDLGWGRETLRRWVEKYPEFAVLYNEGKEELGEYREIGAIERKYDATTVNNTLHLFIPEYADARKTEAEFKAKLTKVDEQPTTKIVVIEKFTGDSE